MRGTCQPKSQQRCSVESRSRRHATGQTADPAGPAFVLGKRARRRSPSRGGSPTPQPILDDIAAAVAAHVHSARKQRRKQRDSRRPVPLAVALQCAQMLLEHHKYFAFLPARVACSTIGLEAPWPAGRRSALARRLGKLGKESEIPNFKGSSLGRVPLVSADFWTSDHLSARSRSMDAFSGTRARGTLMLKRT